MYDVITLTSARQLPPGALDHPRHGETPEAAAARCAARWGCPVAVYVVRAGGPGSTFIGEKREGE